MKVLVTGASGFIGRHLIADLLHRGHDVVGVCRNKDLLRQNKLFDSVELVECDLQIADEISRLPVEGVDAVAHLAWSGLPNYRELFHLEENLPTSYRLLKSLVIRGVRRILVTGTCLEYGLRNGAMKEDDVTQPTIAYSVAKDSLRRHLEQLSQHIPFQMVWARLFYCYGEGQNRNSVLSQLDQAIARRDANFCMSAGNQLRDYLRVEDVARMLALLLEHKTACGNFNVCSGQAVSVRELVETHIKRREATIALQLGHYPYSAHEPLAFWGDVQKLRTFGIGEH